MNFFVVIIVYSCVLVWWVFWFDVAKSIVRNVLKYVGKKTLVDFVSCLGKRYVLWLLVCLFMCWVVMRGVFMFLMCMFGRVLKFVAMKRWFGRLACNVFMSCIELVGMNYVLFLFDVKEVSVWWIECMNLCGLYVLLLLFMVKFAVKSIVCNVFWINVFASGVLRCVSLLVVKFFIIFVCIYLFLLCLGCYILLCGRLFNILSAMTK